jgi:hypothetical protein
MGLFFLFAISGCACCVIHARASARYASSRLREAEAASLRRSKPARTSPPGVQARASVMKYTRVSASDSGRVRVDATRVSPPNAGRGLSQRIHAWHPPSLATGSPPGRCACMHHIFTFQTARGQATSSGESSAPGRRQSCPPRKLEEGEAPLSAGAERRTRGHLAVRPVPSAEGTAGP